MAEVVSRWQKLCWGQPGVLGAFRCAGDIQVCRGPRAPTRCKRQSCNWIKAFIKEPSG